MTGKGSFMGRAWAIAVSVLPGVIIGWLFYDARLNRLRRNRARQTAGEVLERAIGTGPASSPVLVFPTSERFTRTSAKRSEGLRKASGR